MSEERSAPRPLGLGLRGSWIELEEPTPDNEADFRLLAGRGDLNPAMGGGAIGSHEYAPAMLIRDRRTQRAVGVVDNSSQAAGAAIVMIYFDRDLGRGGAGLEAITLYVSHLFDHGARRVVAEVLDFNTGMNGVLKKLRFEPQARLREHAYVAGRYWDLLVYSFDLAEWKEKVVDRFRRRLPGGDRKPAAIGGSAEKV